MSFSGSVSPNSYTQACPKILHTNIQEAELLEAAEAGSCKIRNGL